MRILGRLLIVALVLSPASALAATSPLDHAKVLRSKGRYDDASAALDKALAAHPGNVALVAEKVDLLLELGQFAKAQKAAQAGKSDPRCRTLAAESLMRRGRWGDAQKILTAVLAAAPRLYRARYDVGLLASMRGDRAGARKDFNWFFDDYANHDVKDPESLTLAAKATIRLAEVEPDVQMDFHVTMKILDHVIRTFPDYLPAYVAEGNLYLSVYQDQDAKTAYKKALERNPRYAPALVGVAEQSAFRFNEVAGVESCRTALQTNPNCFDAREYIAFVDIGDSRYPDAEKQIAKVLSVNPKRRESLGLKAIVSFFHGDDKAFHATAAKVLSIDPTFSGMYRDLAESLDSHRRFSEAVHWARKALSVDKADFQAWEALGNNLVNLGREKEALAALQKSRDLDPFAAYEGDPFRENMIQVLQHLKEFVESKSPHFVYKIHEGENTVLSLYYHRFLERSYRMLTKKYHFVPQGPILVEVFNDHADFAARTVGLPGIGALGACFGRLITLDSPSSRPKGAFAWADVAHHEFTHVITLQLSKGRVPRWFTEGLSVYEEWQYHSWWRTRNMDRRLYSAYRNHEIYHVKDFNRAFRTSDVMFAYYLAGRMCEFIAQEFGFPKILEMLKAYGRDELTPEVLKDVLGVTPKEYDARFRSWIGKQVAGWKILPSWSQETLDHALATLQKHPKAVDAIMTVAWAYSERGDSVDARTYLGRARELAPKDARVLLLEGRQADRSGSVARAKGFYEKYLATGADVYFVHMRLAHFAMKDRDLDTAIAQLEAARKCYPDNPEPILGLASLYGRKGNEKAAQSALESYVALSTTDIRHRLELADDYQSEGNWKKLASVLEQVVLIDPLGKSSVIPVHLRLARAFARLSDLSRSELEYRVALDIGVPKEQAAGVHVELGGVYLLEGKLDEARFQAKTALDLQPDFGPAKALLHKLPER